MVEEGIRLFHEQRTLPEILEGIYAMRDRAIGYFMINDLNYLHRGGRMSATSALMGNLLQIKPILHFEAHKLDVVAKVRTLKKAKDMLYSLLEHDVNENRVLEISVVHAHHLEEAKKWREQIHEKFKNIPVSISTLGTVVGVHSGPGAIGLSWKW